MFSFSRICFKAETFEKYQNFLNQRLYDKGPWPSLEKMIDKTRSMLLDANGEKKEILEKHRNVFTEEK